MAENIKQFPPNTEKLSLTDYFAKLPKATRTNIVIAAPKEELVTEVAFLCGKSKAVVRPWMYGRVHPGPVDKEKIAGLLGCPVQKLFPDCQEVKKTIDLLEKYKNKDGFSEDLNRVMLLLMLEVHFEMLVEQWVKELQGPFRKWAACLPDFVGKELKEVRRRHPRLKVFSPPERGEVLAVSWKAERIELFVFEGGRCCDAFGIPADQMQEVMPERLYENLMHCLESKKKLKQPIPKRNK